MKIRIIVAVMLMGLSVSGMENENTYIFKNIKSLNITSDEGNMNFITSKNGCVSVDHNFIGFQGSIKTLENNGTLTVINDKKQGGGNCNFNFQVPAGIPIKVTLGGGDIDSINLSSDFELSLGGGNINYTSSIIPKEPCKLKFNVGSSKSLKITLPVGALVKYPKGIYGAYGCKLNHTVKQTHGNDFNYSLSLNVGKGDVDIHYVQINNL